jgi:hypothetical protein
MSICNLSLHERLRIDIGDEVSFRELSNYGGTYTVIAILTESGLIEGDDSVVELRNSNDDIMEAYVSELT